MLFARYTGKALSPLTGLLHYLSAYGGLFIMRYTWGYRALQLRYYIIISRTQRRTGLVPLLKRPVSVWLSVIQYAAETCCALSTYCLNSVSFQVASASREGNSHGRRGEKVVKARCVRVCVCVCFVITAKQPPDEHIMSTLALCLFLAHRRLTSAVMYYRRPACCVMSGSPKLRV